MRSLETIYEELKSPLFYKRAVKKRIAKIILGASVIRAFKEDTKNGLLNCLVNLDVESLSLMNTQEEYDKWHYGKITSVYNCLLNNTSVII
jgi:hypothetical protein